MKYNITEEERKEINRIWVDVLKGFPEGTESDLEKSVENYIENNGLPETKNHGALAGTDLENYLNETGLTYEDIRTIIED